jgi:hypothetical protein
VRSAGSTRSAWRVCIATCTVPGAVSMGAARCACNDAHSSSIQSWFETRLVAPGVCAPCCSEQWLRRSATTVECRGREAGTRGRPRGGQPAPRPLPAMGAGGKGGDNAAIEIFVRVKPSAKVSPNFAFDLAETKVRAASSALW